MFKNRTHKKLGYKKVKVSTETFLIKKLAPIDFLDSEGVPFTLFAVEKASTVYGQVWGAIKSDEEIEKEDTKKMKLVKHVLNKGVVRFPKDTQVEDFCQPDTLEIGITLYSLVLQHTMKAFLSHMTVSKQQLLYWDMLSKRYGKLPIDCLMPSGNYSDTDSFIFNSLVLNTAIEEEKKKVKK